MKLIKTILYPFFFIGTTFAFIFLCLLYLIHSIFKLKFIKWSEYSLTGYNDFKTVINFYYSINSVIFFLGAGVGLMNFITLIKIIL